LIGTDAKVPVRQQAVMRAAQPELASGFVKHHKIVAGALHFGETDSHRRIIPLSLGQF
jgi:uncharacterized membrane protein